MSERSINENNRLWEAAERIAEKAVADKKAANEEERRKPKEFHAGPQESGQNLGDLLKAAQGDNDAGEAE